MPEQTSGEELTTALGRQAFSPRQRCAAAHHACTKTTADSATRNMSVVCALCRSAGPSPLH